MSIIRTYPLTHYMNKDKITKVNLVIDQYRILAKNIAYNQWDNFFMNGTFYKDLPISIPTSLSARYQQTCQYQVVGMLESYISNLKNDFKVYVNRSKLSPHIKQDLYAINLLGLWFSNTSYMVNNPKGKDYRTITLQTIKLARKIMKHIFKIFNKPTYNNINMALDTKVAKVSTKDDTKATNYDYWLNLSSIIPRKTIKIPIDTNKYFNNVVGKIKKFVQINKDQDNNLTVCFMKELPDQKDIYQENIKMETIAIDLGLRNLFSTSEGDMFGRGFIDKLYYYDNLITKHMKELQKHNIKPNKNKKYRKLVSKVKHYIKNLINRNINKILKLHNPKTIVMEQLNFQSPNLSKRLNRIIGNFGKGYLTKKLDSITELYGVEVIYINPAYTSQECSKCHNIDKLNRKSQGAFTCTFCGSKQNADVNASKTILYRFLSIKNIEKSFLDMEKKLISRYSSRDFILDKLLTKFIERQECHYSMASFKDRTKDNKYLMEHDLYQKKLENNNLI